MLRLWRSRKLLSNYVVYIIVSLFAGKVWALPLQAPRRRPQSCPRYRHPRPLFKSKGSRTIATIWYPVSSSPTLRGAVAGPSLFTPTGRCPLSQGRPNQSTRSFQTPPLPPLAVKPDLLHCTYRNILVFERTLLVSQALFLSTTLYFLTITINDGLPVHFK